MSKKLAGGVAAVAIAASTALPVYANASAHHTSRSHKAHIVFRRVARHGRSIYLRTGVRPGHIYRLEIHSSGRPTVQMGGFEQYTYVFKRQAYSSLKSIHLHGRVPYSRVIRQPVSRRIAGWVLAVEIDVTPWRPFTVELRDISKH